MPTALFILGHAGSGKTKLSKRWVKTCLKKGDPWVLLDKDICGEGLANALMQALSLDPNDRDSLGYKSNVRDLEYKGCLRLASDQLKMGLNVVLPGPWTKELSSGAIFKNEELGFPSKTKIRHIYLEMGVDQIKKRILERCNPRDEWKLKNWDEFSKSLVEPLAVSRKSILKVAPGGLGQDLDMLLLRELTKD
jgi:hypothetical protein